MAGHEAILGQEARASHATAPAAWQPYIYDEEKPGQLIRTSDIFARLQ